MTKFIIGDFVRLTISDNKKVFEVIAILAIEEDYPEYFLEPLSDANPKWTLVAHDQDLVKVNSRDREMLIILYG